MRRLLVGGSVLTLLLAACGSTVPLSRSSTASTPGQLPAGLSSNGTANGPAATPGSSSGISDLGSPSGSIGGGTSTAGGSATVSGAGTNALPSTATQSTEVPPGATAGVSASGPGWTATTVSIGVTTTNDVATVGQSLGVSSINPGDLEADADAMAAYLNANGGILGRKVIIDFFNVSTAENGTTVGQAVCTHFTQDVRVVALLNMSTNGDLQNFDQCVADAHLPTLGWVTDTGDNSYYSAFNGYYNNLPFPNWDVFAKPFVQHLVQEGYFGGWNTTLGEAGPAPVKVGILEPDVPQGHAIATKLIAQLAAVGHAPATADVIFYTGEEDIPNSELHFRADGVTHVFGDEVIFLFMEEYQSQGYHPRYAINTSNAPSLFLQGTVPNAQLTGSMGIGVDPTVDVFANEDPGAAAVPGEQLCNSIMSKAGVSYPPNQRYAFTNMYGLCDGFRLIAAAATKGGGLAAVQVRNGLGEVGDLVAPSMTFANGFSNVDRTFPGAGRDLIWNTSCECYQYSGPTFPLS